MRITVRVQPHSSLDKIVDDGEGSYRVYVRELPEKGRANEAVRHLLAKHFHCPLANVTVVLGRTAREKLVDIREAL